jgi:hypothetical protein
MTEYHYCSNQTTVKGIINQLVVKNADVLNAHIPLSPV